MEGAPQVRLLPSPLSSGSPLYNLLAHTAQAPQSSICCPNLGASGLNSTSSALLQRRGCFACAPFFPQVSLGPAPPLSGVLSRTSALLPWTGSPWAPPSQQTLQRLCSECQCPDSISRRKIWSPGPRGQECERTARAPCLQEPFGFTGDAMPSGRVSPHA